MLLLGTLTGPVPNAGVIALAVLVAYVVLTRPGRARAVAMLGALALAPVLLLADIWNSPQLRPIHHHPAFAVGGAVLAVLVLLAAALWLRRRSWLIAPLVVATLPFRVPIQAGGITSNLLVPLYAVVAAATLGHVISALSGERLVPPPAPRAATAAGGANGGDPTAADMAAPSPPRWHGAVPWVERLLALTVVLYAVQATYSFGGSSAHAGGFEKALQQMVFFYAPFALVFAQLRWLPWSRRLLRLCLQVVAVEALAFAAIGFVEYATKTIILNPKLVVQNDLHTYFTVNSVFFDPDIFGRFLALVMIALGSALLYTRRRGEQFLLTAVLAVLWAGLVLTLSRSSLGALLVGLAALAALRWRPSRALVIGAAVIALGAGAVVLSPKTFGLNQGLNGASSGRAGLVSGGLHMFSERPVAGWGSGSFQARYQAEHPGTTLAASHTIAVTIAAEQGLVGEVVYVALVLCALVMLLDGARGDPSRVAVGAAFLALILHTNLYADFLEDPVTWTLLGVGAALAAAARPRRRRRAPVEAQAVAPVG